MGLTSQIPSDEYVLFYDSLLAGIKVEPGLNHKQYREIKSVVRYSSSHTSEDQFVLKFVPFRFVSVKD